MALHPVGVSAAFLRRLAHDLETSQAFGTVKCHRNIQCSDCGVTPVIGGLHHGEEAWRHEATDAVDEDSGARPPPRRVVTEVRRRARAFHISASACVLLIPSLFHPKFPGKSV